MSTENPEWIIWLIWAIVRGVASLTVSGGQEFHSPYFFLKFWSIFRKFPQTLFTFFLILVLRVGDSPTREGPGYATDSVSLHGQKDSFFTHFWVILSVYWPTMAQMSKMIHLGFSVRALGDQLTDCRPQYPAFFEAFVTLHNAMTMLWNIHYSSHPIE